MWDTRHILKDLADTDRRRAVLGTFWKQGDANAKALAMMHLAKALHFRDETIRKMTVDKKADLLASRLGLGEFEQFFEAALMQYHTTEQSALMAAFLDEWKIPHENGTIESDEYKAPTVDEVRAAVTALDTLDRRDVAIYLATAGLLMGDDWREATWPVVDELAPALGS